VSIGVRQLHADDLSALRQLVERDPVTHCFVASRLEMGTDRWHLGGDLLGYFTDEGLQSAMYVGANLVPVETTPASRAAFADRLRRLGRRCSSIVGRAEDVLDLWRFLEPSWGPAREIRARLLLLVIDQDPSVPPDNDVHVTPMTDLDTLLPACVDMFTGEVGVSPVAGGMGSSYRARVAEIVAAGRSFSRIAGPTVIFKAEIGAVSATTCQVQGVWVDPAHRGQGLSEGGMAAVVLLARDGVAPVVSLYVNDFNTAARKCYATVGFREHGEFATILF
jgi:predicted GNAT family acetyltransferase